MNTLQIQVGRTNVRFRLHPDENIVAVPTTMYVPSCAICRTNCRATRPLPHTHFAYRAEYRSYGGRWEALGTFETEEQAAACLYRERPDFNACEGAEQ